MSLLKDGRLVDGVSPLPTHDVTQSTETVAITGETVTWADGAAGTTQQIKLVNDGIMNNTGSNIGKDGDTSIAFTTGTVLLTEVEWKFKGDSQNDNDTYRLATLANGYYMVDYENGYILGKNAITTSTATDTIAYGIRMRTVTISGGGASGATDIEGVTAKNAPVTEKPILAGMEFEALGAITTDGGTAGDKVPWKAAATGIPYVGLTNIAGTKEAILLEDTAHATGDAGVMGLAVRNDALAALATTDGDYSALQVSAAGGLYTSLSEVLGATLSATNPVFAELTDGTGVISTANPLSVNITDGTTPIVVDTAFTETLALATAAIPTTGLCYGIDADNAGAPILAALQVAVDNATISATPNVLVTGGAYKAAPDTYNDNDVSPFHMDAAGRLLVGINGLPGSVAHDGVDAGDPIKVGGYAVDTQRTAVAAADRVDQAFSLYGETISRNHTYSSQSDRTEEIDPLDEHYVEEELIDTTNVGAATNYYPSTTGRAMGNFNNVSVHYVLTGGVTYTMEAKIDDSTDWIDITPAGFELATNASGAASFVDTSGIIDWDDLHVRHIRIKSVTSDASNGVQYHWKLTSL